MLYPEAKSFENEPLRLRKFSLRSFAYNSMVLEHNHFSLQKQLKQGAVQDCFGRL
jgi:hypothetical protein